MRHLLLAGALLMAAGDGNPDISFFTGQDYLGKPVDVRLAGTQPVEAGALDIGAAPGAPQTGSRGSTGGGGTTGKTTGSVDVAALARALGISQLALKGAGEAKKLFGGSGEPGSIINPDVAAGERAIASGDAFPGETMGEVRGGEAVPTGAGAGSLSTAGSALGLVGAGLGLAGTAENNPNLARAGEAASTAGQAPSGASGLVSAGLGLAGSLSGNRDVATAGQTSSLAIPAAEILAGEAGPFTLAGATVAVPLVTESLLHTFAPEMYGQSHYELVRAAAESQGLNEAEALRQFYGRVPSGDARDTLAALQQSLGPRGEVRSSLSAPIAKQLGVPTEWAHMTPEQFGKVVEYIGRDPQRLMSSVLGSGDVGYLDEGRAAVVAESAQKAAWGLIARQLGIDLPKPSTTPWAPEWYQPVGSYEAAP